MAVCDSYLPSCWNWTHCDEPFDANSSRTFFGNLLRSFANRSYLYSLRNFWQSPLCDLCAHSSASGSLGWISSLFDSHRVGSLFGFMGVLLSDLLQNWSLIQTPVKNLLSLLITIIISLAIGLLPGGTFL